VELRSSVRELIDFTNPCPNRESFPDPSTSAWFLLDVTLTTMSRVVNYTDSSLDFKQSSLDHIPQVLRLSRYLVVL